MSESDKLKTRITNEKNPAERAHLRSELDQVPLTSGELDQVVEREAKREQQYVDDYRQKRKH